MQELLYTSAPRGLKPGSRGFCTVLSTQGMVAPLAAALEGLSGYRPAFPLGHPRVADNPVAYSHLKLQVAGKSWSVLSRVADYGLDYSQRTNKLAHHVVLDKPEMTDAGPASMLRTPGLMREQWDGVPKLVSARPFSRQPSAPIGICQAWKDMTGDAGWAGALAESYLKDPNRPVILLFEPGQDLRPLIDESLSLLPPERRWDVTFSTYFTGASQGNTCLWRGIVAGSKEATESLRFVNALRIDLTASDTGRAKGGELVEAARRGQRIKSRLDAPAESSPSHPKASNPESGHQSKNPSKNRDIEKIEDEKTVVEPQASSPTINIPPRLSPSAFKFANASRSEDIHDSKTHQPFRRLRISIAVSSICLIGGVIGAWAYKDRWAAQSSDHPPLSAVTSTTPFRNDSSKKEIDGSSKENIQPQLASTVNDSPKDAGNSTPPKPANNDENNNNNKKGNSAPPQTGVTASTTGSAEQPNDSDVQNPQKDDVKLFDIFQSHKAIKQKYSIPIDSSETANAITPLLAGPLKHTQGDAGIVVRSPLPAGDTQDDGQFSIAINEGNHRLMWELYQVSVPDNIDRFAWLRLSLLQVGKDIYRLSDVENIKVNIANPSINSPFLAWLLSKENTPKGGKSRKPIIKYSQAALTLKSDGHRELKLDHSENKKKVPAASILWQLPREKQQSLDLATCYFWIESKDKGNSQIRGKVKTISFSSEVKSHLKTFYRLTGDPSEPQTIDILENNQDLLKNVMPQINSKLDNLKNRQPPRNEQIEMQIERFEMLKRENESLQNRMNAATALKAAIDQPSAVDIIISIEHELPNRSRLDLPLIVICGRN